MIYSFINLEPVCCSTSSSNCCFLTCIQVSQEAGQVVWYSHLFQNVPVCCDPQSQASASSVKEKWVFFWRSPAFSMVRWQPEPVSAALPRALSHSSPAPLCVTPCTVDLQAPLSMGFSRQGSWRGSPCPPPGDLTHPRFEPGLLRLLHCRQILYH